MHTTKSCNKSHKNISCALDNNVIIYNSTLYDLHISMGFTLMGSLQLPSNIHKVGVSHWGPANKYSLLCGYSMGRSCRSDQRSPVGRVGGAQGSCCAHQRWQLSHLKYHCSHLYWVDAVCVCGCGCACVCVYVCVVYMWRGGGEYRIAGKFGGH